MFNSNSCGVEGLGSPMARPMRAEQKTVALNDFCHYVMSNYCHHFAEGPSLSKTNKHFLFIGLLYKLAYHVRCLAFTLVFYMTSLVLFLQCEFFLNQEIGSLVRNQNILKLFYHGRCQIFFHLFFEQV